MPKSELLTMPHQVIAEFAHEIVIPRGRKLLEKAKTHRVPRGEIEQALDSAFRVIDRMLEAWPKGKDE